MLRVNQYLCEKECLAGSIGLASCVFVSNAHVSDAFALLYMRLVVDYVQVLLFSTLISDNWCLFFMLISNHRC